MTTAYRADEHGDVVNYERPPFEYTQEGSYARQLLLNAMVVVVLATITVTFGLSLAGVSA